MVINWTANFVVFLLLLDKGCADAINDLKYCAAKMQAKFEMHVKYGHASFCGEKYEYKHKISIKIAQ